MKALLTLALSLVMALAVAANPLVLLSGAPETPLVYDPIDDPTDLAGLNFWHDASQEALADDAAGATITDYSGNSRNGTQATGTARPTYKTGIVNGKAVWRFDGGDSVQGTASIATTALTAFAVISMHSSTVASGRVMSLGVNAAADFSTTTYAAAILRNSSTEAVYGHRSGIKSSRALTYSTFCVVVSVFDGTNHTMYVNGVAGTPVASTGTFAITAYRIGAGLNDANFFNGDYAEGGAYNAALTADQRMALEDYLGTKYGIAITH